LFDGRDVTDLPSHELAARGLVAHLPGRAGISQLTSARASASQAICRSGAARRAAGDPGPSARVRLQKYAEERQALASGVWRELGIAMAISTALRCCCWMSRGGVEREEVAHICSV